MAKDASDIIIEVRNKDLVRLGAIPRQIVNAKIQPFRNGVGTWSMRLPAEEPLALELAKPGNGVVITDYETGQVVMSGPLTRPARRRTSGDPGGIVTVSGVSDSVLLWDSLAWPDPANHSSAQSRSHDIRSGVAETVMRGFLYDNLISPLNTLRTKSRLVNKIVDSPSTNLGPLVEKSVRFNRLGDVLAEIANYSNLVFDLIQDDLVLKLRIREIVDRSAEIRLDIENGTLSEHFVEMSPPSLTRAFVAGQGEGKNRTIVSRVTSATVAAEELWGRRIEEFIDQRNTNDLTELAQKGDQELLERGFTAVSVKAIPSNDQSMIFMKDWFVGDKVTVVVEQQETTAIVTEAVIVIDKDGMTVGAGIGDVRGFNSTSKAESSIEVNQKRVDFLEKEGLGNLRLVPAGTVVPFAGMEVPEDWLLCDGREVSRSEYDDLYAAIGTLYGIGDGSTTFNLPDLRGRAPFGAGLGTIAQSNNFDTTFPNYVFMRLNANYPDVSFRWYNSIGIGGGSAASYEAFQNWNKQLVGFVGANALPGAPPSVPTGSLIVGREYIFRIQTRMPLLTGKGNARRRFSIAVGAYDGTSISFVPGAGGWQEMSVKFLASATSMPLYFSIEDVVTGGTVDQVYIDNYELFLLGSDDGIAATGGARTHVLTVDQIPLHSHLFGADDQMVTQGGFNTFASGADIAYDATSTNTGAGKLALTRAMYAGSNTPGNPVTGGQSHNNMPPFINMNYIIRT